MALLTVGTDMNQDDPPITLEDREPDSFDSFLWWLFVALSSIGALSMLGLMFAVVNWIIRRFA